MGFIISNINQVSKQFMMKLLILFKYKATISLKDLPIFSINLSQVSI